MRNGASKTVPDWEEEGYPADASGIDNPRTPAFCAASPAFLEIAKSEVKPRYGSRPVQFFQGDFTQIAETVPAADVPVLDRVVCCYPEAEALLSAAAARTREILAYSYPRERWDVRLALGFENLMRRRKGNEFQTFVHSPQRMAEVLERAGFARTSSRSTFVWIVDIYKRPGAG